MVSIGGGGVPVMARYGGGGGGGGGGERAEGLWPGVWYLTNYPSLRCVHWTGEVCYTLSLLGSAAPPHPHPANSVARETGTVLVVVDRVSTLHCRSGQPWLETRITGNGRSPCCRWSLLSAQLPKKDALKDN